MTQMRNDKKQLKLLDSDRVIPEEPYISYKQQSSSFNIPSPQAKNNGFITPTKSRDGNNNSVFAPPSQSSRNHLSSIENYQKRQSAWQRFINFISCCCNNSEQEYLESQGGQTQSAKRSQNQMSFKSSIQGDWNGIEPNQGQNSEGKMSQGSLNGYLNNNRNTSNSNFLYNVLQYQSSGYASMNFGHYTFFQIPVRFEQYQFSEKKQFSDIFGRLFPADMIFVDQTYLDWEFIANINKNYLQVICSFNTFNVAIPPAHDANGNIIQGYSQKPKIPNPNNLEDSSCDENARIKVLRKMEDNKNNLNNSDFFFCESKDQNFINTQLLDRIIVVPMSLKSQGDAFDVSFNMRQEFRQALLASINQYIEILYKVIFILPKYCKIKEVMGIIYDAYMKSTQQIQYLNFGIQFHTLYDEFNDVEIIILVFDQQQHLETLQAISQRVFSNINPTIPSLALPSSRQIEEMNLERSNKIAMENSKKSNKQLDISERSTKSTKKSDDDFQISEDLFSNAVGALSNHVSEFFQDDYVQQIGQSLFKNLYYFLKELNTQFIIQDHVFYYRTHVIDVMLKNNIIQQTFIQTLINHFMKEDLSKKINTFQSPSTPIGDKSMQKKTNKKINKKEDNNKKGKTNNITIQLDFKDFFVKNSHYFTLQLDETNDKTQSHHNQERMYSPSDYGQSSETTADQDYLHFGVNNSHQNNNNILLDYTSNPQITSQNNSLPRQNQMSNPTDLIIPQQDRSNDQYYLQTNEIFSDKQSTSTSTTATTTTTTRLRNKQISCNYFTSSTRNKHIGFKSKNLSQSTLDEDILKRTTASKIFSDKKILLIQENEKSYGSKQYNQNLAQEIIPEEIYNQKSKKSLRGRNFSQD